MAQTTIKETTLPQQGCGLNNCCRHITECSTDKKIQILAYQKWEESGHPEGTGAQFWIEAERELIHTDVQVEQLDD